MSPATDPSRAVRHRVVGVFLPNAELVAGWQASMRHRGLSPGTIETRKNGLRLLQTWIGPDRSPLDVTADEIEKWLDSRCLASSNARRDAISNVHSLFTWALRMRMVDRDPTLEIDRPKAVVGMPRPIADADLLLALERATGQRIVPLHAEILEAITMAGLPRDGALFRVGSPVKDRRIDPTTLSQYGNKWLHEQGIEATMHQLRHWFGTQTYRASRDLRMTQELLGHSSPNTTTIYAAWSPGAAVPIVQGLSAGGAR